MYQEPATHQVLPAPLLIAVTPTRGDGLQPLDRPLCLMHTQHIYGFCLAFQGLSHSIADELFPRLSSEYVGMKPNCAGLKADPHACGFPGAGHNLSFVWAS